MDGKGATCVFLHSRDTPPRLCPLTVWAGATISGLITLGDKIVKIK